MDHDSFMFRPEKHQGLEAFDPDYTADFESEEGARASVQKDSERLARYQDILMAHERYGLLVLFQGMDGAGKDSAIKHVMSSLDPQGSEVKLFKQPTEKEIRHDYLWRAACAAPARGQIGIFNRSYYEQLVAERVHPESIEPPALADAAREGTLWAQRFRQVNNFEQHLVENNIHVLKFFLHLSRAKQRERLLERIERHDKRWKFSSSDIEERGYWDAYMEAYEQAFVHTSTDHAPWYIIPDNHRWFARAAVASIIVAKLASLHEDYPTLSKTKQEELEQARKKLEQEA